MTVLFALFTLISLNGQLASELFIYTRSAVARSPTAGTHPLWARHGMSMGSVIALEQGVLFEYGEDFLRFRTTYVGQSTEVTYRLHGDRLVKVVYDVLVRGESPGARYGRYREILEHTRGLVGEREHSTGLNPWRWTLADNVEIYGLDYALSHSNHWAEWVLEEGVLNLEANQFLFYLAVKLSWVPREGRG